MSIAHVIIIIKSEVSTFPIVFIFFPWLCAWDVCYIIFCHLLHIRSGKTGNLLSLLLCSLWWVQIVGYVLPCRSYSFVCAVHHLIIIIVQNYPKTLNLWNACQIYFVECVSKIKHILIVINYTIHYTLCGAVCFQFNHSPCVDWENIYTLSYYHHHIGSTHYLGLGHETIVCDVCLSIFLWQLHITGNQLLLHILRLNSSNAYFA